MGKSITIGLEKRMTGVQALMEGRNIRTGGGSCLFSLYSSIKI